MSTSITVHVIADIINLIIISHALGVKKHVITYCAFIANGQVQNLINMASITISEFFYRFLHGTNLLSESVQIILNCTSFSLKFASMVLYGHTECYSTCSLPRFN